MHHFLFFCEKIIRDISEDNYNDGYHAVMEDSKKRLSMAVVTAEPKLLIINQNIPPNERISPQRREAANGRFLLSQR